MVHKGKLVCYYSDENDYLGFDPATGVPKLDPDERHRHGLARPDPRPQDLERPQRAVERARRRRRGPDPGHGRRQDADRRRPAGHDERRPDDGRQVAAPLRVLGRRSQHPVRDRRRPAEVLPRLRHGTAVTSLPVDAGSRPLAASGSPVVIRLPDGRLVYNAAGSGNVWVNESGRSDGAWKEYQTTSPAGYSRNLQYVEGTGRISILNHQGTSTIAYAEVDLGRSDGAYYQLVNRKTGQVIGTGTRPTTRTSATGTFPTSAWRTPARRRTRTPSTGTW